MLGLKLIFGGDVRYFDLLQESAEEVRTASATLVRLLDQLGKAPVEDTLNDLGQLRRKHKRTTQELTALLTREFHTPLEREDIEALSTALYKITKTVEKIAERMVICPPGAETKQVAAQIVLLERGTAIVAQMVGNLRRSLREEIKDDYERLQAIESDADRLMNELLRSLYRGDADARSLVFWKDIYELLEKGIDRCRDAGYVVFHVVLKNS